MSESTTVQLNHFGVEVPEGTLHGDRYVTMEHGKQYTIRLHSAVALQANATVSIDGKSVGTFRIEGYGRITLERSPEDNGRFTFYRKDSEEGQKVLGSVSASDLGVIQVEFVRQKGYAGMLRSIQPKKPREEPVPMMAAASAEGASFQAFSAGGTGLSGHSEQQFVPVGPIDEDPASRTVIAIRLVEDKDEPRVLQSAMGQVQTAPKPVS